MKHCACISFTAVRGGGPVHSVRGVAVHSGSAFRVPTIEPTIANFHRLEKQPINAIFTEQTWRTKRNRSLPHGSGGFVPAEGGQDGRIPWKYRGVDGYDKAILLRYFRGQAIPGKRCRFRRKPKSRAGCWQCAHFALRYFPFPRLHRFQCLPWKSFLSVAIFKVSRARNLSFGR